MNRIPYQRDQAWATLVSFLGLPAEPSWADHVLGIVEAEERIKPLDGIGCRPVLISATTDEVLEWIGDGLRTRALSFPERNGSIAWPRNFIRTALNLPPEDISSSLRERSTS